MSCSPREGVEIEVNRDVIPFTILSKVAKIDGSVRFVVSVPPCCLQVSLRDVSFASVFEVDVSFI